MVAAANTEEGEEVQPAIAESGADISGADISDDSDVAVEERIGEEDSPPAEEETVTSAAVDDSSAVSEEL